MPVGGTWITASAGDGGMLRPGAPLLLMPFANEGWGHPHRRGEPAWMPISTASGPAFGQLMK